MWRTETNCSVTGAPASEHAASPTTPIKEEANHAQILHLWSVFGFSLCSSSGGGTGSSKIKRAMRRQRAEQYNSPVQLPRWAGHASTGRRSLQPCRKRRRRRSKASLSIGKGRQRLSSRSPCLHLKHLVPLVRWRFTLRVQSRQSISVRVCESSRFTCLSLTCLFSVCQWFVHESNEVCHKICMYMYVLLCLVWTFLYCCCCWSTGPTAYYLTSAVFDSWACSCRDVG